MSHAGPMRSGIVEDKELPPLNVLLHCRTVIESSNFVTTGVMTNVEGELFEVELNDFEQFDLGESVKMTVYSPAGLQTFQSMVFAKYEGAVALILPPNTQKRFKERREHPRVTVSGNAQIYLATSESGEEIPLETPLELKVIDISLNGIGVMGPDAPHISQKMRLKANVEIGLGFDCELEVVRRERQDDNVIFGAKMKLIQPDMLRPLRALILRHQVEKHAELRRLSLISKKRF